MKNNEKVGFKSPHSDIKRQAVKIACRFCFIFSVTC